MAASHPEIAISSHPTWPRNVKDSFIGIVAEIRSSRVDPVVAIAHSEFGSRNLPLELTKPGANEFHHT